MKWFKKLFKRKTKNNFKPETIPEEEQQEDITDKKDTTQEEEQEEITNEEERAQERLNHLNEEIEKLIKERKTLEQTLKPKIDLAKPLGWFLILCALFYFSLSNLVARYEKAKAIYHKHYYHHYYQKDKTFVYDTYHTVKDHIKDFLVLGTDKEVKANELNDDMKLKHSRWFLKPYYWLKQQFKIIPKWTREQLTIISNWLHQYLLETLKYGFYYLVYDWNIVYNERAERYEWQQQKDDDLNIPESEHYPLYQQQIKAEIVKYKGLILRYSYLKIRNIMISLNKKYGGSFTAIGKRFKKVSQGIGMSDADDDKFDFSKYTKEQLKDPKFMAEEKAKHTYSQIDTGGGVFKAINKIISVDGASSVSGADSKGIMSFLGVLGDFIMLIIEIIKNFFPVIILVLVYVFAAPIVQAVMQFIGDMLKFVFNLINDNLKLIWRGLRFAFKDVLWWWLAFFYKEFLRPLIKTVVRVLRPTLFEVMHKTFIIFKFIVKWILKITLAVLGSLLIKFLVFTRVLRLKEDIAKDQTIILRGVEQEDGY